MPDSPSTIVERLPNLVVVRIQHESLDEKNLAAVRAETSAAGAESPQLAVVLDMTKVSFLPSLSLGGLVQLSREFKARGQRFALSGLQPLVRDTMAITRLDRLIEINNDLATLTGPTGTAG
ncbi:MAG TPA: STAS domain-containing protein [Phycisphaerae bacterium]|nr:STAS domain-containing protein [Phycisphaerae bacterium]HRY70625.1 STAS domain-containing protein [Phycisphaerae bacterium]HSA28938.1 STAS domain-containing protein [Phycisphaerae bacterium]